MDYCTCNFATVHILTVWTGGYCRNGYSKTEIGVIFEISEVDLLLMIVCFIKN